MKKLLAYTRLGVTMELNEARKNNGRLFAGPHEGYSVIMEELEEAKVEVTAAEDITRLLITFIRRDEVGNLIDLVDELEERATLAACEFQQVAAMARKLRDTVKEAHR